MAEIAQGGGDHKGGKVRSKKMSTRIDMTPMVDLGFLLITFFVLVTTFSKPSAIDLTVPAKPDPKDQSKPPVVRESKVLQLIPGPNDRLYWFRGASDPKVDSIDFSKSANLRPIIQEVGDQVAKKWGHRDTMIVLIKPMKKANYKNLVDILDEIAVNKVKIYALADFKPVEDSILLWKGRQPGAGTKIPLD
jgi:biopolymer transport protein ExbD